jgi:hypothetical protein
MLDARPEFIIKFLKRSLIVNFYLKHKLSIASLQHWSRHRATLESWHTATTVNSDNNAQHLPEQYRFLLDF